MLRFQDFQRVQNPKAERIYIICDNVCYLTGSGHSRVWLFDLQRVWNWPNPGAQNLAEFISELVAVLRLEYLVVLKSESVAVLIGICIETQIF